jgi:SAM-dependent methyltransferase
MTWTADRLGEFTAKSDALGGPDAPACLSFWQDFRYRPSVTIDIKLDPFGREYASQQMLLYEELSGHPYEVEQHEQTCFDMERHVRAVNPYDHSDATMMGVHLQRLSRAFSCANVQRGELLLDMGCGWGLSSEVAAYLGLRVQGVDINSYFVDLVNRRARRIGLPISAVQCSFEGYSSPDAVDLVLFYECLHHATDLLMIVKHYADVLRPGGRMILAGEPINDIWWPHWGMRLDPLSVYCIRRFGWFEAGWSMDHILKVIRHAGLIPTVHSHPDGIVGPVIVGEKTQELIANAAIETARPDNKPAHKGRVQHLRRAWRSTAPLPLRQLIYRLRTGKWT